MTKPSDVEQPEESNVSAALWQGLSRDWFPGLVLVLAVLLVYQPVWHAGFIWDDDDHVTANPCVVGPLGLKEIWTTSAADVYPATMTLFWLEHALWGLAPVPYHLVNVAQHAVSAVLLWRVLLALRVPGAWLGAALWALHPVEVESVAWISEMKNTQSGFFYLLAILFFITWHRAEGPGGRGEAWEDYTLALFFGAVAMASKSSTVILPAVLCLCAWWMEGRWNWRKLAMIAPFFLLTIIASLVSIWVVRMHLATGHDLRWERSWPERLVTAGGATWFYLGKVLWPHPLMAIYPFLGSDPGRWLSWFPLLAVIAALFIFWWKRDAWARPWFFAFAYFLVALSPVVTLIDSPIFHYGLVFDHFQYLASMGPLALAGSGVSLLVKWIVPQPASLQRRFHVGFAALILSILGVLSWQRASVFQNQSTLWSDTLAKNPECWPAHSVLGQVALQAGQLDEAILQFQEALKIRPDNLLVLTNLGNALLEKGRTDDGIAQYQKALAINPDYNDALNNLGAALLQKGRVNEAVASLRKAVQIDPAYADAHDNLAHALTQKGDIDGAIAEYELAAQFNPGSAAIHTNLSTLLLQNGRVDEAYDQCQTALQLDGKSLEARNNLGFILLQHGQFDAVIDQCNQILAIDPANAEAHYNLGSALQQKGRLDDAIAQFQLALKTTPKITQVHINLGNALFQKGQPDPAVAQYRQALELDPASVEGHSNLAIVLAQQGKLDAAISEFQKALALDPSMVQVHDNLGTAWLQKGRTEEARQQFLAALQLNPGDAYAQKYLATLPAAQGHAPGPK